MAALRPSAYDDPIGLGLGTFFGPDRPMSKEAAERLSGGPVLLIGNCWVKDDGKPMSSGKVWHWIGNAEVVQRQPAPEKSADYHAGYAQAQRDMRKALGLEP